MKRRIAIPALFALAVAAVFISKTPEASFAYVFAEINITAGTVFAAVMGSVDVTPYFVDTTTNHTLYVGGPYFAPYLTFNNPQWHIVNVTAQKTYVAVVVNGTYVYLLERDLQATRWTLTSDLASVPLSQLPANYTVVYAGNFTQVVFGSYGAPSGTTVTVVGDVAVIDGVWNPQTQSIDPVEGIVAMGVWADADLEKVEVG